ncbi:MAG: hypothetical protein ACI9EF_000711 [Pseudohongiellaceae bacterium]|jgi:hypothetical protein
MNRFAQLPSVLALAFALALCSGCAAPRAAQSDFVHMLSIAPNGDPAEVEIEDATRVWPNTHDDNVEQIARAYYLWRAEDPKNHRRILFVIHGGLVAMPTSVAEARTLLAAMRKETKAVTYTRTDGSKSLDDIQQEPFFPIFVNWETGIGSSYADHLFKIREGESNLVAAIPTSPFLFLADFGRALTRLPITYFRQLDQSRGYYFDNDVVQPPSGWDGSAWIDKTASRTPKRDLVADAGLGLVPGALRIATTPLLDGAGLPAFGNMRRRARLLFVRDEDFDKAEPERTGGLSKLMEQLGGIKRRDVQLKQLVTELNTQVQAGGDGQDQAEALLRNLRTMQNSPYIPEVTVIAHSMGAIVANEMVRAYGWRETVSGRRLFDFRDVVYMGAACTLKEFADTMLAYLKQNKETHFYNLCLHPDAEENDRYGWGVLPHGSLLEWIDTFITEQESEMDRTLGKWNNIMRALPIVDHLRPDVRARIVIRGFPRTGKLPTDHGHFNDTSQEFWKPTFWDFRIDPDCANRWNEEQSIRQSAGAE